MNDWLGFQYFKFTIALNTIGKCANAAEVIIGGCNAAATAEEDGTEVVSELETTWYLIDEQSLGETWTSKTYT